MPARRSRVPEAGNAFPSGVPGVEKTSFSGTPGTQKSNSLKTRNHSFDVTTMNLPSPDLHTTPVRIYNPISEVCTPAASASSASLRQC